jgi:hypothetical protein
MELGRFFCTVKRNNMDINLSDIKVKID